ARYGGAISALAGVMDAAQYVNALVRADRQGDKASAESYSRAARLAAFSAISGVYSALFATSLLGPVGFTIILGLAAYTLATRAKNQESSLLELWSRHSRWGLPADHRRWESSQDFDTSIGALNAATLGVTAHASIDSRLQSFRNGQTPEQTGAFISDGAAVAAGFHLALQINLPNFSADDAQYKWQLTVYPAGLTRQPFHLHGNSSRPKIIEYVPEETKNTFANPESASDYVQLKTLNKTLHISNSIPLLENHNIKSIELTLTYWPNKNEQSLYAKVISLENRLSSIKSLF
ncbi:hypothetical protein C6A77_06975, partial [Pseudomonas sp. AFG_SD02_1510_Pfu_092]